MEKMSKNKNLILLIVVVLLVGGIGFFGGMKYQQSKDIFAMPGGAIGQTGPGEFGGGVQAKNGSGQNGNGNAGSNRPVSGEITAVDASSITVKLSNGSSKIVMLTGSTSVYNMAESSKDALKVGEKVNVIGSIGSDGTLSASAIQLGTMLGGGGPAPAQ